MRKLPIFDRWMRRSRVYRGRIGRMVMQKPLKHPCAFMHLPKCGGTSLSEGLYALIPLNLKIGILDAPSSRRALAMYYDQVDDVRLYHDEGDHAGRVAAFREQLLLMHMAHGCDLVHGHFLFSQAAWRHFGDRYKFITIMRDPIARTVSNYRMAVGAGTFVGDFDAFLTSAKGRRMALHNLRYFSGRADIAPDEEASAMAEAEANMKRFAVIGFIEQQDRFVDKFEAVFGSRPNIGHVNKAKSEDLSLTTAQRSALERLCAADITLFEQAKALA
jgi:hypothetical protein